MRVCIRPYERTDVAQAAIIWNQVVEDGMAFPQEETLSATEADAFFQNQSYTGVAYNDETGEVVGLYILHPNNVGRSRISSSSITKRNSRRMAYRTGTSAPLAQHARRNRD